MIPLEEIPISGQLIIAVHFSDYDQYYANETRKAFLHLPDRKDIKDIGIEFYPLDYWLKRSIVSKKKKEKNTTGNHTANVNRIFKFHKTFSISTHVSTP